MKRRTFCVVGAAALGAMFSASAQAEVRDFILEWSGAYYGNQASATGMISIDDTVFNNPGHNDLYDNPGWVTAFSITVTGSTDGDGTWTLADFYNVFLDTDFGPGGGSTGIEPLTSLDLTKELVGQPTSVDPWGTPSSNGGDFNMFSSTEGVPTAVFTDPPNGVDYFTIHVGSSNTSPERGDPLSGDVLLLTSFRPVPAPSGLAAFGLGAGVFVRRRRR